jgi:glutamate-1-semialdehyde 2,1-aminomutase
MLVPESSSSELLARASTVIPGGVNSGRRNAASKICMRDARGAYVTSVDGCRYIDYHASYGPIILGHAYRPVLDHVCERIAGGVLFGIGVTEDECALATKIVEHVPSVEQVLFCNSGSEATYHAIRLARAVTGREKLLHFEGTYHGVHDVVRETAGALATTRARTISCTFNDLEGLEDTLTQNADQVAAIIVEPIIHNAPGATILPQPGFLEGLRVICDREGIVLIFDEVITGFRHHLGGYQAIAGVVPDLTTMAKAIANGFPLAAVGGRRRLMERFSTHPDGDVAMGGTYNGNAAVVAAGLRTIEILESEPVHEHVYALGDRMRAGLQQIADRAGIEAVAGGYGSLFVLSFFDGEARDHRDVARNDTELFLSYRRQLVARGVFEIPENVGRSHISYSHTADDIDRSLEIAEEALAAALDERAVTRGHGALNPTTPQ